MFGRPTPSWFRDNLGLPWLICQSVLVIVGGLGGITRVFTLAALGILAGLIFTTPVGMLTVLPSVLMLISALSRPQAFYEFRPRWKGVGPRPPGPGYR